MFAASKTDSVSGAAPDGQFNYVTMLLHGDGTNGAQNNTFLDSSTNNFTITRNGNVTQGSFSPYGSNWSNFFNGSSYLSTSSSAISYTGNFTVECWFNTTTTTTYAAIYSDESFTDGGTILLNNGSNNGQITVYMGSVSNFASTSTGLNDGKWHHVALSRSSSTLRLFIDGALENTTTVSGTVTTPSTFRIGNWFGLDRYFGGYISNFRVTNTAVYTSSFTPSTTPLTAISGTSLLTCQSNRFVDNSTNNFTITVAAGTPSVQRFNPFGTSTAYSTSVIGGSGYFDGSGDSLSIADNAALDFGSDDFTVEGWFWATSNSGYVVSKYEPSNQASYIVGFGSSTTWEVYVYSTGGASLVYSGAAPAPNQWVHFALERNGSNNEFYFNGTRVAQVSAVTLRDSTAKLAIGNLGAGYDAHFNGYVSNLRVVKGTAVYSGTTYTVPTAPLTAITNTSLLTNFTNAAIFDNAMMNDLETGGNAQISTSVKKYGTGSIAFDGTGDFLKFPKMGALGFGTGNFTIEMWVYPNANQASYAQLLNKGPSEIFNLGFYPSTTQLNFYNGGFLISASSSLTIGAWTHVALVRNGTTLTLYQGGVSVGSATYTTDAPDNYGHIGCSVNEAAYFFNGYIDDLRITNGIARYTGTFTPPTSALSDTGPY
jgi:hypothetical protein